MLIIITAIFILKKKFHSEEKKPTSCMQRCYLFYILSLACISLAVLKNLYLYAHGLEASFKHTHTQFLALILSLSVLLSFFRFFEIINVANYDPENNTEHNLLWKRKHSTWKSKPKKKSQNQREKESATKLIYIYKIISYIEKTERDKKNSRKKWTATTKQQWKNTLTNGVDTKRKIHGKAKFR